MTITEKVYRVGKIKQLIDLNSDKKKTIVFLEFNPQLFSKLFQAMHNYGGNVILVNQRRSAVWNKNSIDIIRKSKCKVLKLDNILNKKENILRIFN